MAENKTSKSTERSKRNKAGKRSHLPAMEDTTGMRAGSRSPEVLATYVVEENDPFASCRCGGRGGSHKLGCKRAANILTQRLTQATRPSRKR